MSEPLALRLIYSVVPRSLAETIWPKNASLGRKVAVMFQVGFAVGASMELFMVKTGFYEVATRKEAERRAMYRQQLEEAKQEKLRRKQERMVQQRLQARAELEQELSTLRLREKETGEKFAERKREIKKALKEWQPL